MAGIIYQLMDVLDEQKECYQGLNVLAKYKQDAVINKDIAFLDEVVKTEEDFVGRISILDKKREELMNDVAIVTGMKKEGITITAIIEKLGSENEVTERLITLRDETKAELEKLKYQNELNKELLNQSLEFVEFMVNAIGSTKGFSYTGRYSRPGEDDSMERQSSIFDHKQ